MSMNGSHPPTMGLQGPSPTGVSLPSVDPDKLKARLYFDASQQVHTNPRALRFQRPTNAQLKRAAIPGGARLEPLVSNFICMSVLGILHFQVVEILSLPLHITTINVRWFWQPVLQSFQERNKPEYIQRVAKEKLEKEGFFKKDEPETKKKKKSDLPLSLSQDISEEKQLSPVPPKITPKERKSAGKREKRGRYHTEGPSVTHAPPDKGNLVGLWVIDVANYSTWRRSYFFFYVFRCFTILGHDKHDWNNPCRQRRPKGWIFIS